MVREKYQHKFEWSDIEYIIMKYKENIKQNQKICIIK